MKFDAPATMFPVIIVQARYGGVYEGGAWFAISNAEDPTEQLLEALGDDEQCCAWFQENEHRIGVGDTPDEAYIMLLAKEVGDLRPPTAE